MFNPKVSIIIPVYNGSNFLAEAIKSALNQTYKNIEILVINDGSNDNGDTEKVAFSFGNKIKYFYKENGGVSTALNFGIEKMTGEYFSWLSHDDSYYPYKIDEQVKLLESLDDKKTVIYANIDIINDKGTLIKESILSLDKVNNNNFLFYLLTRHLINGCTLLIPKNIFDIIGGFNKNLKTVQDYDMWFRMYKKTKFQKIDKSLIKSRQHELQDSRNQEKFILMIKEEYKVYGKFIKDIGIKKIYKSFDGNILSFIKEFILKFYIKIFFILPIFIFIGKFKLGREFISKIRGSL